MYQDKILYIIEEDELCYPLDYFKEMLNSKTTELILEEEEINRKEDRYCNLYGDFIGDGDCGIRIAKTTSLKTMSLTVKKVPIADEEILELIHKLESGQIQSFKKDFFKTFLPDIKDIDSYIVIFPKFLEPYFFYFREEWMKFDSNIEIPFAFNKKR